MVLGKPVEKLVGTKHVEKAVVGDETIDADLVIMSTGVRPQVKLAEGAGCKIGRWAVQVNEKCKPQYPTYTLLETV